MNKEKALVLKTSPMRWFVFSSRKDQWTFHTFYWNIYAFIRPAPLHVIRPPTDYLLSSVVWHKNWINIPPVFVSTLSVQCLVACWPGAWCRGWDSWATIDTRLIIFHISYFSGPGDTSSALRRGPLVHCLWRHCKNSVKDQRRNLKWPQPAASWCKDSTWIISCYQLATALMCLLLIFTRNFYPNKICVPNATFLNS